MSGMISFSQEEIAFLIGKLSEMGLRISKVGLTESKETLTLEITRMPLR
jgi:tRNA threonylcarbamoyladenosine modification (KEOPS) complex  Pcc1 subunit